MFVVYWGAYCFCLQNLSHLKCCKFFLNECVGKLHFFKVWTQTAKWFGWKQCITGRKTCV